MCNKLCTRHCDNCHANYPVHLSLYMSEQIPGLHTINLQTSAKTEDKTLTVSLAVQCSSIVQCIFSHLNTNGLHLVLYAVINAETADPAKPLIGVWKRSSVKVGLLRSRRRTFSISKIRILSRKMVKFISNPKKTLDSRLFKNINKHPPPSHSKTWGYQSGKPHAIT